MSASSSPDLVEREFDGRRLLDALSGLRTVLGEARLPLELPDVDQSRTGLDQLRNQLDDYIIPRVSSLDAPLLAVIGGSTGSGKSTLVNSLVRSVVSRSGVLRPTTLAPVLVHSHGDERWFTDQRVLPGMARVFGTQVDGTHAGVPLTAESNAVQLVASDSVPEGIALLDAPDIDSVVQANRDLARQLLSAADLWIFVTTAARYADAVPWELLREATERGVAVAMVLDRVPEAAVEEIQEHFGAMLHEQGLGDSPGFTIVETQLDDDGLLPMQQVKQLRGWLGGLAQDARLRGQVIRHTLSGALDSLSVRSAELTAATEAQVTAVTELRDIALSCYESATAGVTSGMADGTLLRGEVMARWHELIGAGEWFRQIESGVGKLRDRIAGTLGGRGTTAASEELGAALQTGVAALLTSHGHGAASAAARQWRTAAGGAEVINAHPDLAKASLDFEQTVERLVRDWQGDLLDIVREEGAGKRNTARFLALGVNGVAVLLMIVVFVSTAGLTGAEVGIAGGSAVVAQRLLEAVFGDQAVRTLAKKARGALFERTNQLYQAEFQRYVDVLKTLGVSPDSAEHITAAAAEVQAAR